jgi:hypothetical protein
MVPGGARQDLSKKMEAFIRFVELAGRANGHAICSRH